MAAIVLRKHNKKHVAIAAEPQDSIPMSGIVEVLPHERHWLRNAVLQKRALTAHGTKWLDRQIVLLEDKLAICRLGSDRISEFIPLAGLLSIQSLGNAATRPADDFRHHKSISLRALVKEEFGRLKGTDDDSASDLGSMSPQKRIEKYQPKFEIATVEGGYNGGRRYCLQCKSEKDRDEWMAAIQSAADQVRKSITFENPSSCHLQQSLGSIHNSPAFESFFALVILATFANSIALSEIQPEDGSSTKSLLETLDIIFTIAFGVELVIKMGAGWFREFWLGDSRWWNLFDIVVVSISFVAIFVEDDSRYGILRLVRILRVIRILRQFRALNKIVSALSSSVIPVANAFIILGVVSCIYAIIGVDLFQDINPSTFGKFSSALFTMFQVLTGDSWASAVARPLFLGESGPTPTVAVFFVSFIVINGIFVLNVVIAVLLDEFIGAVDRDKKREKDLEQKEILETTMHRGTAIDPLLHVLSSFSSMDDLTDTIADIYAVLDVNESGGLTPEELSQGLTKLNLSPPIRFSEEDFEIITEGRKLCNDLGEITPFAFDLIIKAQLKEFMKRHVGARMSAVCRDDIHTETILFMLKTLMFSEDPMAMYRAQSLQAQMQLPSRDGLHSSWDSNGNISGPGAGGAETSSAAAAPAPAPAASASAASGGDAESRLEKLQKQVDAMHFNFERKLVAMSGKMERIDDMDEKLNLLLAAVGAGKPAPPKPRTQVLDRDRQTGIGLWEKGKVVPARDNDSDDEPEEPASPSASPDRHAVVIGPGTKAAAAAVAVGRQTSRAPSRKLQGSSSNRGSSSKAPASPPSQEHESESDDEI